VPGPRRIQRGDVVKLDVTVERDGYMADAARTVVVEGAPPEAERLARCAERAFAAALEVTTAGRKVREIGRAVDACVRSEGFTVIRSLGGHGIGRTIHEPPSVPKLFGARLQPSPFSRKMHRTKRERFFMDFLRNLAAARV